jgi:hypothetical protein
MSEELRDEIIYIYIIHMGAFFIGNAPNQPDAPDLG